MENFPTLSINAEKKYLSIAVSFVENSCASLGFSTKESNALTLASEEIFTYLCSIDKGCKITIECKAKSYFMEIKLRFNSNGFNPRAFNITSKINVNDESSLDEMGLLIASRLVDSFTMNEIGENIVISLQKFKIYQSYSLPEYQPKTLNNWKIETPEKQEVKVLAALINQFEKLDELNSVFKSPLLLADKFEAGDIDCKVLKGETGSIAGGIFWQNIGYGTVEMFGPFIYNQSSAEKMGYELVDNCLQDIGKENFKGLLCRNSSEFFPQKYFEIIGSYSGRNVYFRELQEDIGAVSWIHPDLQKYLANEYSKLFLPRDIIPVVEEYENCGNFSVVSSAINRSTCSVILSPVIYGKDFSNNIKEHVELFVSEKYTEVLFEIDLGISWHSFFIPQLIIAGFEPSVVLPFGGKGDLLIFKLSNTISERN